MHYTKQAYSTDDVMKQVFRCLVSDFSSELCGLEKRLLPLTKGHVRGIRLFPWPAKFQASVPLFKRVYQLENLFKRYIFAADVYDPRHLEEITVDKFISTQLRIGNHIITRTPIVHQVLQRARCITSRILGKYDFEEHVSLCNFGRKATVGSPLSRSYLDEKIKVGTGSLDHIQWFRKATNADTLLHEALHCGETCTVDVECDTLTLTNVPKSWKTLRSIMPNTGYGAFYTSGLGKVIERRLRDAGLNIRKLQDIHKRLAQRYSKSCICATADLSAASDSFTHELLNMLLPRKWYNVIKFGRVPNIDINGRTMRMVSFMGMGIGFTFPLQTLCFYSILQAIKELSGCDGVVSVYGDDLIYPRTMHRYVRVIFNKLGFLLNADKTFCVDHFRESCGGDYYHGADVRPFQPEGACQLLSRVEYLAYLYKTINGLLRRWHEFEIPSTLHYLLRECLRVTPHLHEIPDDYADYSGIHTGRVTKMWYMPWSPMVSKTGYIHFEMLTVVDKKRIVPTQTIYLWSALQQASNSVVPPKTLHKLRPFLKRCDWLRSVPTPILKWTKVTQKDRKKGGKTVRKLVAYVPLKQSSNLTFGKGSTPDWAFGG